MFHPDGPTFFELAVQALSSTERGYDLLAPKFDYTPFRTPDSMLQGVADELIPLAPFASGLDICCGTGAGLEVLKPLCRERVVGLDFSQGMLHVCRERLADAPGSARVELVLGNALAMPFGAEFDVIVSFSAFGHIRRQDEPRFVSEIARVLKPGGRFVFATAYKPPAWSLQYWLARSFNAAMHVRNFVRSPPFIMYYLTFLLPGVQALLEEHGFSVEIRQLGTEAIWRDYRVVIATRR